MASMTAAGSTLAISAASPATPNSAGYAALSYTTIGGIEKIGTVGATFNKVEFKPLNGPIEKHKGSVDYGSLQPTVALDLADAGQVLLQTATDSQTATYAFKLTLPDGAAFYFQGKVFGMPMQIEDTDSILKANPTVEINTKPVKHTA